MQGREVGVWEVTVVLGIFLRAHGPRLIPVGIKEPRLLYHRATVLDERHLPRGLHLDGALQETK